MQSIGCWAWGIRRGHNHNMNSLWREGVCVQNDETEEENNQHELSTYCVPGSTLSALHTAFN